ncbi:MAG: hypothetical protein M3M87_00575 [Thermoproteota archaeon]|nr:hypothetical protein [Thermoproteota archaeon]
MDTFPGRVFLGLGRGESLNEVPAGTTWPSNKERFEMLEEAIRLTKSLTCPFNNFKAYL